MQIGPKPSTQQWSFFWNGKKEKNFSPFLPECRRQSVTGLQNARVGFVPFYSFPYAINSRQTQKNFCPVCTDKERCVQNSVIVKGLMNSGQLPSQCRKSKSSLRFPKAIIASSSADKVATGFDAKSASNRQMKKRVINTRERLFSRSLRHFNLEREKNKLWYM